MSNRYKPHYEKELNRLSKIEAQLENLRLSPFKFTAIVLLILLLEFAVTLLVYQTGGIKFVYAHFMYIPILLGAFAFGLAGGIFFAVIGAIALGPWMPIDVSTGQMQQPFNWLMRMGIFVFTGVLASLLSEYLKKQLRIISWFAFHDPITNLPNKLKLEQYLSKINAVTPPAVIMIHIVNLQKIECVFGINHIEELMNKLYQRTRRQLPLDSNVFLYQIDQLVIALAEKSLMHHKQFPEQVIQFMQEPISISNLTIQLDIRVGVVRGSVLERSTASLLQHASTAVAQGHQKGKVLSLYEPANVEKEKKNLLLLGQFRKAIKNNELELYYQPKVSSTDQGLIGCEALVRWNHPSLGMVPPGDFMPQVENTDLIHPLTAWVVEQAAHDRKLFAEQGLDLDIAINISVHNLNNNDFVAYLVQTLKRLKVSIANIELEVTESGLMHNPQQISETLNQLKKLGFNISIDDFGTGQSSLTYVSTLPVNTLKIDQSFVRDLDRNDKHQAVVNSVVGLCKQLNLKVVAEGVETEKSALFLKNLQVDILQGYLYGKPMPLRQLLTWHESRELVEV